MPLRVAWKNELGLLKLGFFFSLPSIAAVWYLGRAEGREQNTCEPFSQASSLWWWATEADFFLLQQRCFVVPFMFLAALWTPSPAPEWCSLSLLRHLVLYNKELKAPVSPQREGKELCAGKPLWGDLWAMSFVTVPGARAGPWLLRGNHEKRPLLMEKWNVWGERGAEFQTAAWQQSSSALGLFC